MIGRRTQKKRPAPPPLPDHVQAIYQKAANGHLLEQVLWGKILLNSVFVPADPAQAFSWFSIAAQTGYGPALNMLGRCYHFGWGVEENLPESADYYAKAAAAGDEWGRYNLAILHMRGLGMARNLAKAFQLFQIGAHNGHAKSMNIMARFYEEGWVVKKIRPRLLSGIVALRKKVIIVVAITTRLFWPSVGNGQKLWIGGSKPYQMQRQTFC